MRYAHILYTEATTYVIQHNYKSKSIETSSRTKQRQKKYLERVLKHGSPSTLRSICQGFMQQRLSSYVPIRLEDNYLNVL